MARTYIAILITYIQFINNCITKSPCINIRIIILGSSITFSIFTRVLRVCKGRCINLVLCFKNVGLSSTMTSVHR